MSFSSACIEWENAERNRAIQNTFGHLAPEKNKVYPCTLVFASSCYGDTYVLKSDLPCSPWMYECEQEFVHEHAKDDGVIYKFVGTFKNYKFVGKVTEVQI